MIQTTKYISVLSVISILSGCGAFSNTAEDVAIQKAYYAAYTANQASAKPTLSVSCDNEFGCKGLSLQYTDPSKVTTVPRVKTSAEVSSEFAQSAMGPLNTLMQVGGVAAIVNYATKNSTGGNSTSTTNINGNSNNATDTIAPTTQTGTFSDSHATQTSDSHDATATPTVVDTKVEVVNPEVVNPVVVNPEVVNPEVVNPSTPTVINNGAIVQ